MPSPNSRESRSAGFGVHDGPENALTDSAPIEGCSTFHPERICPLSFLVVAADKDEAREAVDAYVREHCADGNEAQGWADGR
jgi:hypothetical protein